MLFAISLPKSREVQLLAQESRNYANESAEYRVYVTNKLYFINRSFVLMFVGIFYIKGTKYLTFRQYITNSFKGNAGDVSSPEPPNTPDQLLEELLNLATIKANPAKNVVKAEAIDTRKGTGFDKVQHITK